MRYLLWLALFVAVQVPAQKLNTSLVYSVHPAGEKSARPPVLILLHGYGSNESDLFSLAGGFDKRFLVFSLRAPHSTSRGGFCWFPLQFLSDQQFRYDYSGAVKSRQQVMSFIRNACRTFGADSANVFLMGFSQGAIMCYELALSSPGRIKGVVALSGRMLPETMAIHVTPGQLRNTEFFIAHGTQDAVIKFSDGEKAQEFLRVKGAGNIRFKSYDLPHTISRQELADIGRWLSDRLASPAKTQNRPHSPAK